MIKKKLLLLVILSVFVIAAATAAMIYFTPAGKENNPYSVVYLTTNEIYIGRLIEGAKLTLTDIYLLQIIKDPQDETKSSFQLSPLKEAIWSPEKLYISEDKVIFYGPIEETSKVAEAIKAAKK